MSDDMLDDLFDEDADEGDNDEGEDPVAELKAELENLKKEKFGLLQDVKGERKKRQEFQSELDTLKGTVAAILEQNANRSATDNADTKSLKGIPLEYNDEGEAFLPPEKVNEIISAATKKQEEEIANLKAMLQAQTEDLSQKEAYDSQLQAILGENESYTAAYNKYKSAREWANKKVIEFQKDNNIAGFMNSAQALDYVFDADSEKEFAEQFPKMNLEDVILAGDSQRLMRKALNNIASSMDIPKKDESKKIDSNFQKVLNKPSGLGKKANAKASGEGVDETLGTGFSSLDILNLSDAQIKALEKALLDEEKTDGVKF